MSAWIRMIPLEEATGKLKEMYQRVTTPHGTVDNVMKAHSLRPHTMEGHLVLYKNVLHNPENTLPFWFLEVVASCVSLANQCDYSLTHHFANAKRLINDEVKAKAVWEALSNEAWTTAFSAKEAALLAYAHKLTVAVSGMKQEDIEGLRQAGCDDGEILEVNQVCAYFNYSNRLLNGLGVTTQGDVIGYYKDASAS